MGRNGNAQYFCVSYSNIVHFTDQNWISKTVICNRCVMVCKTGFANWNTKIALLRASMVVTYYIKLFWMGADRHNGILMSLLLPVADTITLEANYGLQINKWSKVTNLKLEKRRLVVKCFRLHTNFRDVYEIKVMLVLIGFYTC